MFEQPFFGVAAPTPRPNWWPPKGPAETLVWSENVAGYVLPTDVITEVEASIAPSGSGELQMASISVLGQTVSLELTGGQPRRIYIVQMLITTALGNEYQVIVNIGVRAVLPTDWPPVAPSPGFGPPIIWPIADSGLALDGAALSVTDTAGWPTSAASLPPGALWLNGAFVSVVPGGPAANSLLPLAFGGITAAQLLASGGSANLPIVDPLITNQLWLNGSIVCVSAG